MSLKGGGGGKEGGDSQDGEGSDGGDSDDDDHGQFLLVDESITFKRKAGTDAEDVSYVQSPPYLPSVCGIRETSGRSRRMPIASMSPCRGR